MPATTIGGPEEANENLLAFLFRSFAGSILVLGALQFLNTLSVVPLFTCWLDEPIVDLGPIHAAIFYVAIPGLSLAWIIVVVGILLLAGTGRIPGLWVLSLLYAPISLAFLWLGSSAYVAEPWYWWTPAL